MKLYHGTSFENACKILSEKEWRPLIAPNHEIDFMTKSGKSTIDIGKWKMYSAIFTTTNVNHAVSYANQFERPVILWFDYPDAKESGDYIFRYNEPIDTSIVKAYVGVNFDIEHYGTLLNAIYGKGKNKYIIKSPFGGLIISDNPTQMKKFFQAQIDAIDNL